MLNDLIALRNKKQPKNISNTDVLMYDYGFWTEVEKATKKAREHALDVVKTASEKPDVPGVILASQRFKVVLEQSQPIRSFNLEIFIDSIMKKYPQLSKPALRELATAAVVPTKPRSTYKVMEVTDRE